MTVLEPTTTDLYEQWLSTIQRCARKHAPFAHNGLTAEDLIQTASLAFLAALKKWDQDHPGRNAWMYRVIKSAIRDELRSHQNAVRFPQEIWALRADVANTTSHLTHQLHREPTVVELAEYLDNDPNDIAEMRSKTIAPRSLDETQPDIGDLAMQLADTNSREMADRIAVRLERQQHVARILDDLPKTTETVVRLKWGLDANGYELENKDIAKQLGKSTEWVRLRLREAERHIRHVGLDRTRRREIELTPKDIEALLPTKDLAWYPLSGASLVGADLDGADLTGANLDGADLTGANLNRAKLTGANLNRANLTGANLDGADLTETNLNRAKLTEANLNGANLTRANLKQANLDKTVLIKARLQQANLTKARLHRADLTIANLDGANLARANLTEAKLTEANLTIANLDRANLARANLNRAKLTLTSLVGAQLDRADLEGADLTGADLTGATLIEANLDWGKFAKAILNGADLTRASLTGVRLTTASLDGMRVGSRHDLDVASLPHDFDWLRSLRRSEERPGTYVWHSNTATQS